MTKLRWSVDDIPDQTRRIAIVTGSSSGVGRETARVLAKKNASVTMAVRNVEKGERVAGEICREFPSADVKVRELDLSRLDSIEGFAQLFLNESDRLDLLINNAGIMMCPFAKTEDGFEIQFGVNHLGHFALTGHLMPLLKRTAGSRVVVVSSLAHRRGNIDFSDPNWESRRYNTGQAYCDSKLANLCFAYELSRKLQAEGGNPMVTAAHPGWTGTELQRHSRVLNFLNLIFAQSVEAGALPILRAATDPDAEPGHYYGPSKLSEMRGPPARVDSASSAKDIDTTARLWALSEQMTSVRYSV